VVVGFKLTVEAALVGSFIGMPENCSLDRVKMLTHFTAHIYLSAGKKDEGCGEASCTIPQLDLRIAFFVSEACPVRKKLRSDPFDPRQEISSRI
jgi:hypothetical protein